MGVRQKNYEMVGIFKNRITEKRDQVKEFDLMNWLKKTAIRTVISVVILSAILGLKSIQVERAQLMSNQIDNQLNSQITIREYYQYAINIGRRVIGKGEELLATLNINKTTHNHFLFPLSGTEAQLYRNEIMKSIEEHKAVMITGVEGEEIVATEEGVVIEAGSNQLAGNFIVIRHKGELSSVYKHLQERKVQVNATVNKGDVIGLSSDQLRFELWYRNELIDPSDYLGIIN